jgi:hypothetical protein
MLYKIGAIVAGLTEIYCLYCLWRYAELRRDKIFVANILGLMVFMSGFLVLFLMPETNATRTINAVSWIVAVLLWVRGYILGRQQQKVAN